MRNGGESCPKTVKVGKTQRDHGEISKKRVSGKRLTLGERRFKTLRIFAVQDTVHTSETFISLFLRLCHPFNLDETPDREDFHVT